jgi:chromosome segregation ATPase
MSTAGKALVICVALATLVWLILAGGVAQLNRNGNELLQKLTDELASTQTKIEETVVEIASVRDQTTATQEKIDRDVTALRANQHELEEAHSEIVEVLTRLQNQLATVEDTIKGARADTEQRNVEHKSEEKAMADLRSGVQNLKNENGQLMARLDSLRNQFQTAYHGNLEMLGKKQ